MKVLITGGSGFLGTHLRKFFEADDLSRRSGLDILDQADARKATEYDVVIHLAARLDKSPDAADDVFNTNVNGTINLLRAMREGSTFIFASTKDVYGRFADNYKEVPETCPALYGGQSALEWSKLIAERYIEYYAHQNGFRSCIFRLSTIYAPRSEGNTPNFPSHYADAINTGERLSLPAGGTPVRDLLHVDDFASACKAFIESVIRHGIYNVGGGRDNALSLKALVAKLEEVSGLQAILSESDDPSAPVPLNYVSDLGLASQELGWKPEIGLDEGLRILF